MFIAPKSAQHGNIKYTLWAESNSGHPETLAEFFFSLPWYDEALIVGSGVVAVIATAVLVVVWLGVAW